MELARLEEMIYELRCEWDDLKTASEANRSYHRDVVLNLLSEMEDALLEAVPVA